MADTLWTSDEIVQATGGKLMGKPFTAAGVSIDTRSIEPGDLFVALGGVRDGHEFVSLAMEKGAVGALASQRVLGSAVMVADTLQALEGLGVAARERATKAKRGAVTGSVGKTSVTQAIMAGLKLAGRAHGSVKSYNNHIGVPLTLARMPADTERAVFEIGMNHSGEIRPLTRMVRPHAAVVTTVGPVHTENFPDGETGVAHAKAEVFEGLQPGGVAVLNADDRWFGLLKTHLRPRRGLRRAADRLSGANSWKRWWSCGGAGAFPRQGTRLSDPADRSPLGPQFHGRAADAGGAGRELGRRSGGAGRLRTAGGPGRGDGRDPGKGRLHSHR
jgi:UDP-N-acetylmuramyl pentapeptide synthase